jgi:hypothetical protein
MLVLPPLSALLEVLPAAAVAGILLFLSGVLRAESLRRAGAGLALGAGCAVAIGLVLGRLPEMPGRGIPVADWPFHFAVAGAGIGVILSSSHVGWPVRFLVATASMVGVAFLLLEPIEEAGNKETLAVAAVGAVVWLLLDGIATRRPGPTMPIVLSLAAFLAVQAMIHGRSAKVGEMAASLSAALGGAVGVAFVWRTLSLARGGTAVYSMLITGCLVIGAYFDALPLEAGGILLAAPLFAWVGEIPPLSRAHPAIRIGVATVLVAAVGLAAVYLAWTAHPPDEYGYF